MVLSVAGRWGVQDRRVWVGWPAPSLTDNPHSYLLLSLSSWNALLLGQRNTSIYPGCATLW